MTVPGTSPKSKSRIGTVTMMSKIDNTQKPRKLLVHPSHSSQRSKTMLIFVLAAVCWFSCAKAMAVTVVSPSTNLDDEVAGTVPHSPRCWASAVNMMFFQQQRGNGVRFTDERTIRDYNSKHDDDNNDSPELFCATLSADHQKWLALEIARCHLQDLDKPLIATKDKNNDYSVGNNMDNGDPEDDIQTICSAPSQSNVTLYRCLRSLSNAGATAYTFYVTHVQQWCLRLTHERREEERQAGHRELARKHEALTRQSVQELHGMQALAQQHTEQLRSLALDLPDQIRESVLQESEELRGQLKETLHDAVNEEIKENIARQLREQLDNQLGKIMRDQASAQAAVVERMVQNIELRDTEHQKQFLTLWRSQASEMEHQRIMMEEQRVRLETHRENVRQLSDTVTATTRSMQPLLGLESLVTVATKGYSWATFLLHFLGTFNVVWLCTRPPRCHFFRSHLYALVFLEAFLEIALTAVAAYGQQHFPESAWFALPFTLNDSDRIRIITALRQWAFFLECGAYLIGVVLSFFIIPHQQQSQTFANDSNNKDDNCTTTYQLQPQQLRKQYHHPTGEVPVAPHSHRRTRSVQDGYFPLSTLTAFPPPPPPHCEQGRNSRHDPVIEENGQRWIHQHQYPGEYRSLEAISPQAIDRDPASRVNSQSPSVPHHFLPHLSEVAHFRHGEHDVTANFAANRMAPMTPFVASVPVKPQQQLFVPDSTRQRRSSRGRPVQRKRPATASAENEPEKKKAYRA